MDLRHVVERATSALRQASSDISSPARDPESRLAALRVLVVAGCALTAIPAAALLVRELIVGDWVAVLILTTALAIIVLNLIAARWHPYSIWPSRLMAGFAIYMIAHGVWFGDDEVRLIWPLVLPPVFLFVYGRAEGAVWTAILFIPCAAFLLTGAVDTGSAIDFLLAYLFLALCAFVFMGLHAASRGQLADREVALRGAAMRFQDFAEIDSDWFFELDAEFRFQYSTGKLLRVMGAAEQTVLGRNIFDLGHLLAPSDPGNLHRLSEALTNRQPLRGCRFALVAPGDPIYVDISVKPYVDPLTNAEGFRGVVTNVTEVVQQQSALLDQQRVLHRAQKMEAVGQLTSGLAHDLNNIITVIGGNLDLLNHYGRLNDRERRYAADAMGAATRASELMSALLAFARQQPLDPITCDLSELFTRIQPLLERALDESCELDVLIPPDVWPVHVDPAQLESSLLNLALNGRDAMPGGGRLIVESTNEKILVEDPSLAPGPYVKITVTDTGGGIAADIRELIFDPFFTTKGVNEGSGLGLSMVYGFARQSRGDIRVQQTGPQGTTFALYLPRADASEDDRPILSRVAR